MGKSIKFECVIQILSRSRKHEQVLKFPTHILSAQSGSVTAHKWFDAARGPVAVWGGGWELSFHRSSGPGLLTEPFHSPWPGWGVQSLRNGPLAPGIHTFHALCVAVLRQHSSRQSAWWSCELLPTHYLIPNPWFAGHRTPTTGGEQSEREQSSWSFQGVPCPYCPIFHMDNSTVCVLGSLCEPVRRHTAILCEMERTV